MALHVVAKVAERLTAASLWIAGSSSRREMCLCDYVVVVAKGKLI
jgi:hypothetical protein